MQSPSKRITKEVVEAEYPDLHQLLAGYLHQGWPEIHRSPERAIDDAIAEGTPDRLRKADAQFRQLRLRIEDDADLRRVLNRCLGANVHFPKPRDARAFADGVKEKLERALKEVPYP